MGAAVPYILRRLDTGTYHFQGEAYVHGIMDGEYLIDKYFAASTSDKAHNTDMPRAESAAISVSSTARIHQGLYSNTSYKEWLDGLAGDIPFPTEEVILS